MAQIYRLYRGVTAGAPVVAALRDSEVRLLPRSRWFVPVWRPTALCRLSVFAEREVTRIASHVDYRFALRRRSTSDRRSSRRRPASS